MPASLRLGAQACAVTALVLGLSRPVSAQLQWTLVDQSVTASSSPVKVDPVSGPTAYPQPALQSRWPAQSTLTTGQRLQAAALPIQAERIEADPGFSSSPPGPNPSRYDSGLPIAQSSQPAVPQSSASTKQLRESLLIDPIVKFEKPWPSPSLSPGVPSAFVANWGDVFAGVSGATAGKQRDGVVDGSFNLGFGLGSSEKAVALELSGGCGSINRFCANGSFTGRIGRLLINEPDQRLALAAAWQNFAQWGEEGRQDNIYYGALTYAIPLRPPGSGFGQTLQFNAGVGNSTYAPFTESNSEDAIGGFGSIGIELSPALGLSAGWSGRGANAQLSYTPFRDTPITLNLLGSDLFNQTPAGAVAVFSISWGTNFTTSNFN